MLTLILSALTVAPPPGAMHPIAVDHRGRLGGEALEWQTTVVVDAAGLAHGSERLALAAPLPAGATVETGSLTAIHDDDGRMIAIDVPTGSWGPERHVRDRWTRTLAVTIRLPVTGRGRVPLVVPLFAGDAVQRISMAGMEDLMLEPDPSIGVERHIRDFVAQEVTSSMRRNCNRLLKEHGVARVDSPAIFVSANRRVTDAGSLGEIVSRKIHRQLVATSAFVGCALIALLMALAYKRLSRTAQIERSLALIDRDLAEAAPTPETREDTR